MSAPAPSSAPQDNSGSEGHLPSPHRARSGGRLWHVLLTIYLVLLAASTVARWMQPEPALPPGYQQLSPKIVQGTERGDDDVRLAYLEWPWQPAEKEEPDPDPPQEESLDEGVLDGPAVILLVHGSPGGADNFYRLAPLLAEYGRVLAPDLPGFGQSTFDVPDYSVLAHSDYVAQMLDQLAIERVHLVGFSMGGGVVLHLAERYPQRVASVTLLSAIGVQEAELMGQYHLNHAVHGFQLGGLWLLRHGVPHFGAFDHGGLDVAYARNFFDTDQRPLRGILEDLDVPMLIVHGEGDVLVPAAAAREHHRIVPHSELVMTDANHFMVFRSPESLRPIGEFVQRVEAGEAPRRVDATESRLAAAADPDGFQPPPKTGLALVVMFVLIAIATLVSEDLACIATGLVVAQGGLTFFQGALACFLGIYIGDMLLYFCGRLGRRWLRRRPFTWFISEADVERSRHWFEKRGSIVILLSRFLPGTRLPTYVAAGMLHIGVLWFAINLLVPVAIWTPLLVGISQRLGEQFFTAFESFQRYALPGFVAALVLVWILLAVLKGLSTHRGRRQLAGWWRRKVRWEYWPPWVFYPPVVLYVLWLGIRHRGFTVFTAVNPGMPAAGGFIGESKSTILDALDPAWVAPYRVLPEGKTAARRRLVDGFREDLGLPFPIVLKPDTGERGAGVAIAHREEDIDAFLATHNGPAIVQQFVDGPELGIFYVRHPAQERGRIFSITDKQPASVQGDGTRRLEQLILDDPRLVAMAPTYLDLMAHRLDDVPEAGERVTLTELGTHCRGAIFLDGSKWGSESLEASCDRIAGSFDGFYFGRFDARSPSFEAFREGRDFKILELNGVTSEATHIYDPSNGLWDAYRVLFEQWRLAFEIGAYNRSQGAEVTSVGRLLAMLLGSSR